MIELHLLIKATSTTLKLALCALVIGLILAISFAVLEELRMWKWLTFIGKIFFSLFCGLPEILIVLFIYLVTSQSLIILVNNINDYCHTYLDFSLPIDNFNLNPLLCGIIALALIYASYAYYILRGAIKAISKKQWESGQALGMNNSVILFHLILPQIWRLALPGLGNQWLVLLKDTTLVSLISVNDLMLQTKSIITITHKPFTWYVLSSLIYLVITLFSQVILFLLERFANRFEKVIT
ncbi:arginine ABC transporter permease ArtQ [Candidatus Palibaumannia cicadellinicola]|uniref:Arginine ABC transporter, permease protein ArtQ n=1 Tax=Candidatus Palibaumannia cicadellinicola TaxID=186490 RepID=A0A088MY16_9GAMM|nr:arginine ABC transporter permease ArtQ [Candidatus Baumannia cicadellinicola]AIN47245.1 Arginine ABC transporter, permease protein ArtQ [Candidatus Baumannia cicadellinicola]